MKYLSFLILTFFLLTSCSSLPTAKCYKKTEIDEPISFLADDLTFVNNNLASGSEIESELGYLGKAVDNPTYQPEIIYYSFAWDTAIVAYRNMKAPINEGSTFLTITDLEELENYILTNFRSSQYRLEYGEYLKIIRLYPDRMDVLCSNSDGCSSANPQKGFIDIYNVNKNNIYSSAHSSVEPRINILVHEYGHIFNYYNLHLKGSIAPSYYLSLRLGEKYKEVFPNGLPVTRDNPGTEYYIYPTEIGADDYVELFYQNYDSSNYNRLSLKQYPAFKHLEGEKKQKIIDLYQQAFSSPIHRFEKPVVLNSNCQGCRIEYYTNNFQTRNEMNSRFEQNLIALSAKQYNGKWYYEVILSNLMLPNEQANFLEQVATRIGYVQASWYHQIEQVIYVIKPETGQINYVCGNVKSCTASNKTKYHVRNDFPFSYFIDFESQQEALIMYEYKYIKQQVIGINKYNFIVLI